MPERQSHDPLYPTELPQPLAEYFATKEAAALLHGTDQGTAVVVKLPSGLLVPAVGAVPIRVTYELRRHPQAPIISTRLDIYDLPGPELSLETFTNIGDAQQAEDFEALAEQDRMLMLFYDEAHQHRLSRWVTHSQGAMVRRIVELARQEQASIPAQNYNFAAALTALLERRRL